MSILDNMVACVAMFHHVWLSVSLCNYHVNLLDIGTEALRCINHCVETPVCSYNFNLAL